jgi:hypothetical protein
VRCSPLAAVSFPRCFTSVGDSCPRLWDMVLVEGLVRGRVYEPPAGMAGSSDQRSCDSPDLQSIPSGIYMVFHPKCGISFQEPRHATPTWAISRTPITGKQSQRKSSVQIHGLPSRPGFVFTGRFDRPFDMASTMDQRSIALYLYLKRMGCLFQRSVTIL